MGESKAPLVGWPPAELLADETPEELETGEATEPLGEEAAER